MSRFRLTAGETAGIAVMLACVAMPLIFNLCSPAQAPLADTVRERERQHRIDSAQRRDDSLRSARDSLRALRAAQRAAAREKAAKAKAVPLRSRLDEPLN